MGSLVSVSCGPNPRKMPKFSQMLLSSNRDRMKGRKLALLFTDA